MSKGTLDVRIKEIAFALCLSLQCDTLILPSVLISLGDRTGVLL